MCTLHFFISLYNHNTSHFELGFFMVFTVGPCFQIHSVNLGPFISVCGFLPQKAITDIRSLLLVSFSLFPQLHVSYGNVLSIPSQLVCRAVEYPSVCFAVVLLWALWCIHGKWHCLYLSPYLLSAKHRNKSFWASLPSSLSHTTVWTFFILTSIIKLIYETLKDNGRATKLTYTFVFHSVSSSFP